MVMAKGAVGVDGDCRLEKPLILPAQPIVFHTQIHTLVHVIYFNVMWQVVRDCWLAGVEVRSDVAPCRRVIPLPVRYCLNLCQALVVNFSAVPHCHQDNCCEPIHLVSFSIVRRTKKKKLLFIGMLTMILEDQYINIL